MSEVRPHHRVCVRAFPRAWRERYEAGLLQLLAETPQRRWQGLDLLRAGISERVHGVLVHRSAAWIVAPIAKTALPVVTSVAVGVFAVFGGGLGSASLSSVQLSGGGAFAGRGGLAASLGSVRRTRAEAAFARRGEPAAILASVQSEKSAAFIGRGEPAVLVVGPCAGKVVARAHGRCFHRPLASPAGAGGHSSSS